jgi:predicted alpha/beta-fold hydrolase
MHDQPFKPAWWLRNPHLQTIWPALCRRKIKNFPLVRERIELPDGDFLDLDWMDKEKNTPIVLILHGFEGSIDSHYAKSTLRSLKQHGWRGVFMHFRGCSGEPNRLTRGYHSGETSDLANVVRILREREPTVHMAAIGYSLGGNVLLKWVGETGSNNPLNAAIAISVPFNLHMAADSIQNGFSRFYQWYLLKSLRARLFNKFQSVPSPIDPELITEARNIRDFDNVFTAPLHGFVDANHYYDISSSRQYLRDIAVPTLIVHAKDDPFMCAEVIPAAHELSPEVRFELSEQGGHVGFVTGNNPLKPEYWLEKRIPEFLQAFLK